MGYVAGLLTALVIFSSQVSAAELEIGRMRVAIWPEYDSSGVLYIYDGRFKKNELFPNETSFYVPPGAMISDVCSLSPKGQHFCQLYKQKSLGDFDEVHMRLPYPNFYLSFHIDPFKNSGEKRVFKHVMKARHNIDKLEIDLQQPLRAENFRILEPAGFEKSERKGFVHYMKVFENVKKGDVVTIAIEYVKKDHRPSVNIKYSPMSGMGSMAGESGGTTPYERRRKVYQAIYVASAVGVVVLVGLFYLLFRGRREQ